VGNSFGISSDFVGGCENYATILPQKRNGYIFDGWLGVSERGLTVELGGR